MTNTIGSSADFIDIRDVIARFEELEPELTDAHSATAAADMSFPEWLDETAVNYEAILQDAAIEYSALNILLGDLKGYGGDEQWRGDWYPVTLIARSHFVDYCEELLQDIGALPRDMPGYLVIDMQATADNLEVDYSTVNFEGNEFLYR